MEPATTQTVTVLTALADFLITVIHLFHYPGALKDEMGVASQVFPEATAAEGDQQRPLPLLILFHRQESDIAALPAHVCLHLHRLCLLPGTHSISPATVCGLGI